MHICAQSIYFERYEITMKKVLSFGLVFVMVLALLCSCQPADEGSKDVSVNDVSVEENTSGTTSETEYVSGLPEDLKFNGDEFIIFSGYAFDITPATMMYFGGSDEYEFESNVVNDASIERINRVEERLDVDIKEEVHRDSYPGGGAGSSFYNHVVDANNSGTASFHMAEGSLYNMAFLTTAGCLTDLTNLEHLNGLQGEWWSQTFINDTSIKDSIYYAVGDISFAHINCIYLLYFNKTVQANNGVPDLYELVDTNKWTYDKMFEITKDLKKDLDGDPAWTARDQYGLVGQASIMWAIAYACGEPTVKKDADGLPVVNLNSETSITKIQKALEYLTQEGNYLTVNEKTVQIQEGFDTFIENRTLFMPDHTGNIAKVIGQMTGDFGFLPHPKYDENQEDYYALISPWGGLGVGVPYIIDTAEEGFVSAVMEEMAVQGKNLLTPAYIEKLCKLQKTTDERSKDMLDIIFTNSGCELGMIHAIGGFPALLHTLLSTNDTNVQSKVDAAMEKANSDIQDIITAIENMK